MLRPTNIQYNRLVKAMYNGVQVHALLTFMLILEFLVHVV